MCFGSHGSITLGVGLGRVPQAPPEMFHKGNAMHAVQSLVENHLGRLQGDSRTEMLKIIDGYGHVHNCKEVNVVIVARRLSIADTQWWQVDTRTGQFFFDDAVGYNYNQKYRWTPGQPYGIDTFQSSP